MAEQFLEEIYSKAKLIFDLKCIQEECYKQRELHLTFNKIKENFYNVINDITQIDSNTAQYLSDSIMKAVKSEGYGVRGDILETTAIPILYEIVKQIGEIDVIDDEGNYQLLSSKSGFMTIKDLKRREYLHSCIDPMWEAKKMAEDIYEEKFDKYVLRGTGLGYLPYQLYQLSQGSVQIHIFEKDQRMVDYAKNYGVLGWIPEENLMITIDKDILSFIKAANKENTAYYFPNYELSNIPEYSIEVMSEVISESLTYRTFRKEMLINFYRNINSGIKLVYDLEKNRVNKECIVVGAGPSVDECIDFLKASQERRTIIAVGTILKKLLRQGVRPDFVVVYDPQEIVYQQITVCKNESIPLLIGSFAYWKLSQKYQGEKYLIPIAQLAEMEEYAIKNNIELWESGGTVVFTAMDFALHFGVEKLYLVGVDLSYPNGISHAADTGNRKKIDMGSLFPIEGVGGNTVYTDTVFRSFLEAIEYLITKNKNTIYYNMSKVGARIKGTIEKWDS